MPGSPLHDGAVIVQRGRIVAAGCFLPLTLSPGLHHDVGTRHRAALGLTAITMNRGWSLTYYAAALRAHLKEAMGRETDGGGKATGVPTGKELHSP